MAGGDTSDVQCWRSDPSNSPPSPRHLHGDVRCLEPHAASRVVQVARADGRAGATAALKLHAASVIGRAPYRHVHERTDVHFSLGIHPVGLCLSALGAVSSLRPLTYILVLTCTSAE